MLSFLRFFFLLVELLFLFILLKVLLVFFDLLFFFTLFQSLTRSTFINLCFLFSFLWLSLLFFENLLIFIFLVFLLLRLRRRVIVFKIFFLGKVEIRLVDIDFGTIFHHAHLWFCFSQLLFYCFKLFLQLLVMTFYLIIPFLWLDVRLWLLCVDLINSFLDLAAANIGFCHVFLALFYKLLIFSERFEFTV